MLLMLRCPPNYPLLCHRPPTAKHRPQRKTTFKISIPRVVYFHRKMENPTLDWTTPNVSKFHPQGCFQIYSVVRLRVRLNHSLGLACFFGFPLCFLGENQTYDYCLRVRRLGLETRVRVSLFF